MFWPHPVTELARQEQHTRHFKDSTEVARIGCQQHSLSFSQWRANPHANLQSAKVLSRKQKGAVWPSAQPSAQQSYHLSA